MFRFLILLLSVSCLTVPAKGARPIRFNQDIRPILSNRCFRCHGPDEKARANDLRLDVERIAKRKLASGIRAIVSKSPGQSHLLARIRSTEADTRMPPPDAGPALSQNEIRLLTEWIKQGAKWEKHWSLVPPQRPQLASGHGQPIDRFVQAKIRSLAVRLPVAQLADRRTLIRRLYLDLTGLPPTPEQVSQFVASRHPAAYEQLVERLLASPHFGERMAIHWLDLVRYADSVGYHGDQERSISPYRTYVINAWNQNMPFDRFTVEQLAGDLLPRPTLWQRVAAGYNMLGMTTIEGGAQPKEYLAKYAADRVRTTSGVWLAATLGCAECHDHKFDPFSTKDFYRFAAFFADIQQEGKANPKENLAVPSAAQAARLQRLDQEIQLAVKAKSSPQSRNRLGNLKKQRAQLVATFVKTIVPVAGKPRTTRVFPRGDWLDESGVVVSPGVPNAMGPLKLKKRRATRLDLARWLVARQHPLTGRVFVNRLWKHFFGAGLSNVLDDVGSQGEWPTHPKLLDWLAVEFMESGWDIKHVVRLMVVSQTYRRSSIPSPPQQQLDPNNRYFARQSRFRLSAELIRDGALSVSGLILHRMDSDRSRPYQPAGYYDHLNFPKRKYRPSRDGNQYRRGVYVHWQRTFLHPALLAFDAPSREECTARRPRSNTPQAALTMLNDPSMVEAALALARRVVAKKQDKERVAWLWQLVLARHPTPAERSVIQTLVKESRRYFAQHPKRATQTVAIGLRRAPFSNDQERQELAAWTNVCRAVLNLSEAITRN